MIAKATIKLMIKKLTIFQFRTRVYRIQCSNNNETEYLDNIRCEINSLKKGFSGMTVVTDIVRPITSMTFQLQISHTTTKKLLHNITIKYCESFGNFPKFIDVLMDFVKAEFGNLIHECPYEPQKNFGIEKFPVDEMASKGLDAMGKFIKVYQGEYSLAVIMIDKKKKSVFVIKVLASVTPKRDRKFG